jgi:hypothetical protein
VSPEFRVSAEMGRAMARWRTRSLAVGVVLLVGWLVTGAEFHGYLMGFLFWWGLAMGSLALLMTQYLTGGAWGVVTQRIFEASVGTLPLLAAFFIPFAFGLGALYDWAHPELVRGSELLRHRAAYLNPAWFFVRAAVFFAIWITLAYALRRRWSAPDKVSAVGLIVYVFTVTLASVDWAESLRTQWYSTMWGFLFVVSQGLTALSFTIVVAAWLRRGEPMRHVLRPSHFHDLGKLLLMSVMLWAYFSFSQLLIVWAGNLAHEIPWYLPRFKTSWGWVGVALIVLEFVLPFMLLLSMPLKRNARLLAAVCGLILVMRFVDLMWIALPDFWNSGFHFGWGEVTAPLGIGGVWLWFFLGELPKAPLLPVNSPFLEEALAHGED